MSLERSFKLQTEVENNPTLVGYQALLGEEMTYLKEKRDRIVKAREKKAELEAIKQKLLLEKEKIQAERLLRELTVEEQEDYNMKWLNLLKEYTKRKETLSHLIAYSPAAYKVADLVTVAHWLDTWSTFFTETESSLRQLRTVEKSVSAATPVLSTQVLYDSLDEVCRLQLQVRASIGRERYRRSTLGDEAVEDFLDSQQQLMSWCRKQRETVEELSTLEDLAAFSDSFQKNVPVMDSNFLVLLDQSEPLADNPRVQSALQELNEEWVQLCLMNFEKLQDAVREVHIHSPLEAGCAAWMNSVEPKIKSFLDASQYYLSQSSEEAVDTLTSTCSSLTAKHDAFSVIATHLSDYTIRDDCVRPHTDALKNELTTAFTSSVLSLCVLEDYEGKQEYRNRLEELRDWVEVKSQKGTYVQLLDRLEDTKAMIQEYADALFPDEPAPSNESSPIDLSYREDESEFILGDEEEEEEEQKL